MPREDQTRAVEVIWTEKSSKLPPPYKKETRGLATAISPADMGKTKNRLVWTVWRRVSRKAPSFPPAVSRAKRGKMTLVMDKMKVPAMTRYRLEAYSRADTPAPS